MTSRKPYESTLALELYEARQAASVVKWAPHHGFGRGVVPGAIR